jgi:hypothetical protein
MNHSRYMVFVVILVFNVSLAANAATPKMTLSQVRSKYLGKQVVVTGALFNDQMMLEWHTATPDGTRYVESGDGLSLLPVQYRGQTATVVAVQLNSLKTQKKINALGEMTNEDDTVDPYFDLVVKFKDGSYGMLTTYSTIAEQNVQFADEQQKVADMIRLNENKLIGTPLYACEYSHLYEPDTTLEEMTGSRELLKRIDSTRTPLLKPLPIQNIKFIAASNIVVMKLKLPDDTSALAYTPLNLMHSEDDDKPMSPTAQIAGSFFTSVPKSYSPKEIDAIQKGTIFRGMSKEALECVMGFAKNENDWGTGGKQLVFSDTFLVYLDHFDKVVNWQSLGN